MTERNDGCRNLTPQIGQTQSCESGMEIVEYFTSGNQQHWLEEIRKSDWGAGQFLYRLLRDGKLKETVGQMALVPMLVEKSTRKLVSYCTFAPLDDIQPTNLSPWIGFVYTFPAFRGHRYAGQLLDWAESLATVMGKEAVYISTGHTGLYERYGYCFFGLYKDISGDDSRVYRKELQTEGDEKKKRLEQGNAWKEQIVSAARAGQNQSAVCGFSCKHCFLQQWCGGCRSVFCCCSYGTLFPGDRCPNVTCCEGKGLDGCYECPELEACTRGFFKADNDGAAACKAQALFLHRYGKEEHFRILDRLHTQYDFEKIQQILGHSTEEGLRILESCRKEREGV